MQSVMYKVQSVMGNSLHRNSDAPELEPLIRAGHSSIITIHQAKVDRWEGKLCLDLRLCFSAPLRSQYGQLQQLNLNEHDHSL